jgi:acetyl-CoA acyltransferase 1
MERLNTLNNQLSHANNDNDVVICYAKRTPLTKSKKGALKDTSCEMLLFHLLKDV